MGVVEDSEPPLKRLKLPFGASITEPTANSLGELMARPLTSQGDDETLGTKGLIRKTEFVRIITRALYALGFDKAGALLEEESGIPLYSSLIKLFIQQVKDGLWDESVATLRSIDHLDEKTLNSASFMIMEQKFFELVKKKNLGAALDTLRNDIVPLHSNMTRVHELAAYLISPLRCLDINQDNDEEKHRSQFLEKLQMVLPPSVMIPEKRLEHLVERALNVQRDACVFHNASASDFSLFADHHCGRNHIPSQTMQVLEAHGDEVWFLQFSHNGKYLASSSKDQSAVIWEVKDSCVSLKHTLKGHQQAVLAVSWSPNDSQLLTCGQEEVIRRWDMNSGDCLHVYEKIGTGVVSCGWFPDGRGIFAGMTDKSICLWDLDGKELECWKRQRTVRTSDMAITSDGKRILSICRDTAVLLLDRELQAERLIEENDIITSFSLSKDNKFLLVNLINQEIHLWNIEGQPNLVSVYRGHIRTRFVVRSCFGGFEQSFIASGSEDSQVYIWHRITGELLRTLPGHSGAVNAVSWNPSNLHMLASASDDHTIRIWGLNNLKHKQKEQANGIIHHSNGTT